MVATIVCIMVAMAILLIGAVQVWIINVNVDAIFDPHKKANKAKAKADKKSKKLAMKAAKKKRVHPVVKETNNQ